LLEQGMAKLSRQENQFLLARIRGLTFGEIGQRFGFTRARVHQVTAKALDALRKTWGPRVPRLLDMVKRRLLLSNASELTPALLEQWVGESSRCLRLSRKAHVRLIAELDADILLSTQREFLCWNTRGCAIAARPNADRVLQTVSFWSACLTRHLWLAQVPKTRWIFRLLEQWTVDRRESMRCSDKHEIKLPTFTRRASRYCRCRRTSLFRADIIGASTIRKAESGAKWCLPFYSSPQ